MKNQGKPSPMSIGDRPAAYDDNASPLDALAQVGAIGMQQTRTQHTTAIRVQNPRNMEAVEKSILHEATLMGDEFTYYWEVNDKNAPGGKAPIEGLSIDGARILYRNMQNVALPTRVVSETPTHWLLESIFIDLENGAEFPRLYQQRKGQSTGGMQADRAQDIAFQIGQSKVQRNAIESGMPRWLVKKAIEAANAAAEKMYEDVEKWRKVIVGRSAKYGVTEAELEAKAGAKLGDWLPKDVAYLASVLTAIAKRESSVTVEFRSSVAVPQAEPSQPAPTAAQATPEPSLPDDAPEPVKTPAQAEPAAPSTPAAAQAAADIDAAVAKALAASAAPPAAKSEPKPADEAAPPKGAK